MKRILILLVVLTVGSMSLLGVTIVNNKNKFNDAYYSLKLRNVESNLVELEGAIQFQRDNNWANPFAVTEKVRDIIEGIDITLIVSKDINNLKKENEEDLSLLHKIISKYNKYGDFPDGAVLFKTQDQEAFIKLGNDLRKAGWGMGESFGKNDGEFKEAVNNLYNFQKGQ